MTQRRALVDRLPGNGIAVDLSKDQAHHLANVLRQKNGDEILAIDGNGGIVVASLQGKKLVYAREYSGSKPRAIPVSLGIACLKSQALELVVEKAVELGVCEIQIIYSEYSQKKDLTPKYLARLQTIADEALKQCERLHRMKIRSPEPIASWSKSDLPNRRIVLSERSPVLAWPRIEIKHLESLLVVGPEGGWSRSDLRAFEDRGFSFNSLNNAILRAETAAIAACAIEIMQYETRVT